MINSWTQLLEDRPYALEIDWEPLSKFNAKANTQTDLTQISYLSHLLDVSPHQ